jgi:hypothetical protein
MVRVLGENERGTPGAGAMGCCTGCVESCPITRGASQVFFFLGDLMKCPTQIIPSFM